MIELKFFSIEPWIVKEKLPVAPYSFLMKNFQNIQPPIGQGQVATVLPSVDMKSKGLAASICTTALQEGTMRVHVMI